MDLARGGRTFRKLGGQHSGCVNGEYAAKKPYPRRQGSQPRLYHRPRLGQAGSSGANDLPCLYLITAAATLSFAFSVILWILADVTPNWAASSSTERLRRPISGSRTRPSKTVALRPCRTCFATTSSRSVQSSNSAASGPPSGKTRRRPLLLTRPSAGTYLPSTFVKPAAHLFSNAAISSV